MTKYSTWLILLTVALLLLAAGNAFGASVAGPGQSADPTSPPSPPVAIEDEPTGESGDLLERPKHPPADWQAAEADSPTTEYILLTPDGSFMDAQSRASAGLEKVNSAFAPGIYMARDWRPVSKTTFPMLVGGHDTFTWDRLEPTEGVYDTARLDNMIAANAASGKKTAFGISTYNGRIEGGIVVPAWLKTNYPSTTIDCGSGWKIPRYWNSVYQTKYRNLIQYLANRYKNNPDVAWVQIGVGLYGEIQPADDSDDTCVKNAMAADGRTDYADFWVQTIDQIIDIFMQNFNNGKPTFLVYTPSFVSSNEKCLATQYGAGKYNMGVFAGGIYANQTGIFNSWPTVTYPVGCQKWDPILYWNNSPTATVPVAFESYRYMLPNLDNFYWGILNALNKHPDYLNLESDLFFSNGDPNQPINENFPMMYFANTYLGKTRSTSPNAWVAMREYDPATNGFGFHNAFIKPQFGNYDFWLYQDQSAPGGRTITATTVNQYYDTNAQVWRNDAYYDPILVGKGPQGWTTRRTSHSTGNDYFYLNIDDQYVSARGIQNSALITVTWFDVITTTGNTWALEYKDLGGNTQTRTVTRNNTRTWRTTGFYITDANFANGFSGSDFRLYNGGSADLYVHMVMIGPADGGPVPTETPTATPGGPTMTPTATGTPTLTPTITNTPPPGASVRINAGGQNYTDIGGNLWLADRPYATGSWGYYSNGTSSTFATGNAIGNTSDDTLYQDERYWTVSGGYTVTLPNGNYSVELRFAEIFYTQANLRKFQVRIQENIVLDQLDIVALAGANTAYDRTFPATVSNGILHIQFIGQTDSPKINAIYVYPGGAVGPTSTPTATPTQTPGGPTPTPTNTWPAGATVTVAFQNGVLPTAGYAAPDTHIVSGSYTNYCTSSSLYLRNTDIQAGLIRFPLTGIPSNATVLSATLSVYVDSQTNPNPLTTGVYRMLRDWDACSANWYESAAPIPWGTAGANNTATDRVGSASDYKTFSAVMAWYDFNVTGMVQTWVSDPGSNKGLILKTETGSPVQYSVRSGDFPGQPSSRPKLTVIYAISGPLTPTPTETPVTPSSTPTPSVTATRTETWTPTITPGGPTLTPTHTRTHTQTPAPTSTNTQTLTVTPTPTISYQVRVNAGGPNYTDSTSKQWLADQAYAAGSWGYVGGVSHSIPATTTILNTSDPTLYRTDRWWNPSGNPSVPAGSYKFDVPGPGLYQVDLHFAETYHFQANKRVFSVKLEGTTVLNNFDIFLAAGGNKRAFMSTQQIQVNDGTLNIDFFNSIDTPTIMAIRVVSLQPATATPTRTSTITQTPTRTNTPTGPTATPTQTSTFTPTGTPTTPPGCPDIYEPDNVMGQGRVLDVSAGAQRHSFHTAFDVDWVYFSATAGVTYTIWTNNLAGATDTVLELYNAVGQWMATNDDDPALGTRASRIIWSAPATGSYFLKVYDYSTDSTYGCTTGYDLDIYVGAPTPTPSGTATATGTRTFTRTATASMTRTPTLSATATATQTPIGTPTRTGTVTRTGTATATGTNTLTPTVTRTSTATFTASATPSRTGTATATGTRTFTVTPTPTPVGEMIGCNSTVSGDTRGGANRFVVYPCGGGSETGPEQVYYLILNNIKTVRARILSYTQAQVGNPDVFILSSFDNMQCVPGGYADGSTPDSIATYTDAPPGITYIVVDGWQNWAERFTLEVTCSSQPLLNSVVLPIIMNDYNQ